MINDFFSSPENNILLGLLASSTAIICTLYKNNIDAKFDSVKDSTDAKFDSVKSNIDSVQKYIERVEIRTQEDRREIKKELEKLEQYFIDFNNARETERIMIEKILKKLS